MIGFKTIGNVTFTVFDDKPVLSTDPWIYGDNGGARSNAELKKYFNTIK